MDGDFERCYRAIQSRDARFDGRIFTAVTSTGIYCRPTCPAQTPRRENLRFYPTAAAARAAGFRACRRCLPDLIPPAPGAHEGSLAAEALRLITDGAPSATVAKVATRLGVSRRQVHRRLIVEVGTGPLQLLRARRAQTARALTERTRLPLTEVAFAAGFASLRQFNQAFRDAFGLAPSELRRRGGDDLESVGPITVRLQYRAPLDLAATTDFLGGRAVAGVEELTGGVYRRSLRLDRSAGVVEIELQQGEVIARLHLDDLADLGAAVAGCRRLLDLDADPRAINAVLGSDPQLAASVERRPGLRIPGAVDPFEIAIRAIMGQQVSVARARTLATRLALSFGEPLRHPVQGVIRLFPSPSSLAGADLSGIGLTAVRARTIGVLATAVASGELRFEHGADAGEMELALQQVPGIGPWTAAYISMRGLGNPDAFPAGDLGIRRSLLAEVEGGPGAVLRRAESWRPWRAYAAIHLWHSNPPRDANHVDRAAATGSRPSAGGGAR